MSTTATGIAAAINANIDQMYAGEINYEAFKERAESLWAQARELRIANEVGTITCPKMRSISNEHDNQRDTARAAQYGAGTLQLSAW
jgi:hypothetical protein